MNSSSNRFLNLFLFIFLMLAVCMLRAFHLDNTQGLLFSELNVFDSVSSFQVPAIFQNLFTGNLVFSLYSLILSWWNNLLGSDAYVLRFLSIIFGTISCLVAFSLCEKPKNHICLILFAINSFLITYSQQVGMASLLLFLTVLNLYAFLKIRKDDKGYILWVVSSVGMVLTSIFAILFVLLEVVAFVIFKREDKTFFKSCLVFLGILIPYFTYIAYAYATYANTYLFANKSYGNVIVFLQNFFSPIQTEIGGKVTIDSYLQSISTGMDFYTLGFVVVPVIISIYFIIKSFYKDRFNIVLFVIGILYLAIRVVLQFCLGIPFGVDEHIIVLPIMLILFANGVEKNVLSIILFVLYLTLNLSYLFIYEDSAFNNNKQGVLAITDFLNTNISQSDAIITWTKINNLEMYLGKEVSILDIKGDFSEPTEKELVSSNILNPRMLSKNKRDALRMYFVSRAYPTNTVSKIRVLYGQVPANGRVFLIYQNSSSDNYDEFLNNVASDDYFNTSYEDIMQTFSIVQLNKLISTVFKFEKQVKKDNLVINIYKK